MIRLVLVRHGQSVWNLENRFTGWTDVQLSSKGVLEAKEAGEILKRNDFHFDLAYTSVLRRAEDTLSLILKQMGEKAIVKKSYLLNERHYGKLQGLNKEETAQKYGDDQVMLWRRSADVRPPALDFDDPRYPGNDIKYRGISDLPLSENLLDTANRVIKYYNDEIKGNLKGHNIIIVAHGNSLRGLIKYLDNISDEDIVNLEIPTGRPICYEFDDDLKVLRHYYVK